MQATPSIQDVEASELTEVLKGSRLVAFCGDKIQIWYGGIGFTEYVPGDGGELEYEDYITVLECSHKLPEVGQIRREMDGVAVPT